MSNETLRELLLNVLEAGHRAATTTTADPGAVFAEFVAAQLGHDQ
jgi:hypothetical protein